MQSHGKNGGLDQYGAEPFERQQFETAGVEGVKAQSPTCCVSPKPKSLMQLLVGCNMRWSSE